MPRQRGHDAVSAVLQRWQLTAICRAVLANDAWRMTLKLFELVGTDETRPFSPFCWRTRMALAHKGPVGRNDPVVLHREGRDRAASIPRKVPVLLDGETAVVGSLGDRELSRRYLS